MTVRTFLAALATLLTISTGSFAQPVRLTFAGSDALPAVPINGQEARIHTQGLYVTADHYYVTGRAETEPKRPLFLRFNRKNLDHYESIDITPDLPRATDELDHPGGFDLVGDSFFVPVARSEPRGPTTIVRIEMIPEEPLTSWRPRTAFQVDDHIGALCHEPTTGLLYGANWDTRAIYVWEPGGKLQQRIDRSEFIADNAQWQLAVQDWKPAGEDLGLLPGTIMAGGIDKSPGSAATSPAVFELLQPRQKLSLGRVRLSPIADVTRPLTNEGLAWYQGQLFLLPEDIGRGAKVLRFNVSRKNRP